MLQLAEIRAINLWVGPSVLSEADEVFRRKAPHLLPQLAALLHQANVRTAPEPTLEMAERVQTAIDYPPDQQVLAEALAAQADFLATHDRAHFLNNPRLETFPFQVGTPGDCLHWLRQRLHPPG